MCRNIKTLFNFEPPATEAEIHAASLQFVRKISGFNAPSRPRKRTRPCSLRRSMRSRGSRSDFCLRSNQRQRRRLDSKRLPKREHGLHSRLTAGGDQAAKGLEES